MPNEKELLFKHRKGIGREHAAKPSSTAKGYPANEDCRILVWSMAQRSGDGTYAMDGRREGADLMALYLRKSPSGTPTAVIIVISCGDIGFRPIEVHSGQE